MLVCVFIAFFVVFQILFLVLLDKSLSRYETKFLDKQNKIDDGLSFLSNLAETLEKKIKSLHLSTLEAQQLLKSFQTLFAKEKEKIEKKKK